MSYSISILLASPLCRIAIRIFTQFGFTTFQKQFRTGYTRDIPLLVILLSIAVCCLLLFFAILAYFKFNSGKPRRFCGIRYQCSFILLV